MHKNLPRIFLVSIFAFILMFSGGQKLTAVSPLKHGAYTGWQTTDISTFQDKVGQPMDITAVFIHWGNENSFPQDVADLAQKNNQTLLIYWEAMDYNSANPISDSRFSYDQILSGKYDQYLTAFSQSVKAYGLPVILIPFEEMNGDWYPWSVTKNGNTPALHQAAYRYVHNFFTQVPNVKFGWAINNDSVPNIPENNPLTYYPGDAYVDFVGANGFNFGNPWQTFDQVFNQSLTALEAINKPQMIFSMACAPGVAKANWIQDAALKMVNYPQLIGWVWFNENKERDWRVWSDPDSLTAFKNHLLSPLAPPTISPGLSPLPTFVPSPTPTAGIMVPPNTPYPTLKPTSTPTRKLRNGKRPKSDWLLSTPMIILSNQF